MGAFSNLDLENQINSPSELSEAQPPAAPQQSAQPAQTQSPFVSPFLGGAFSGSPFVSAAPPQTAPKQPAASPAPQQQVSEPVPTMPAQQSSTTPVEASSAPEPSKPAAAVPGGTDATDTPADAKPQGGQTPAEGNAEGKADEDDEAAKRKAHEEAEAKRKAEHEAKFAERRAKEKAERERVAALSDDDVMSESMARVSKGFEQLTRRNMKDMVSEYIQTMCVSDPAFARNVMNPVKSMINCVKYINNKAREYIQKDMEDNDMKPENGMYGGDVPDDIVYQWAVDYFNDPNAKEDEVKEEKFVPKPYVGKYTSSSKSKKDKEKEKAKKEAEKKAAAEKKATEKKAAAEKKAVEKAVAAEMKTAVEGQISLMGAVA